MVKGWLPSRLSRSGVATGAPRSLPGGDASFTGRRLGCSARPTQAGRGASPVLPRGTGKQGGTALARIIHDRYGSGDPVSMVPPHGVESVAMAVTAREAAPSRPA